VAKVLHNLYSRYRLKPFEHMSTSHDAYPTIFLHFVYKKLSRKPSAYRTVEAMEDLLKKYASIPPIIRCRYTWSGLFTVAERWRQLGEDNPVGCANGACPERMALSELKSQRQPGVRDSAAEERLLKWGGASKFCKRCWEVTYCSVECQKARWPNHKDSCTERSAKEKNEMIIDIEQTEGHAVFL